MDLLIKLSMEYQKVISETIQQLFARLANKELGPIPSEVMEDDEPIE